MTENNDLKDLPISKIRESVNDDNEVHAILRQGDTLRAQYLRKKDELLPPETSSERMEKLRESGKTAEVAKVAQQITEYKDTLFEDPNNQDAYDKVVPLIEEFASHFN